jgi:WD40 repeat protein
VPDQPPPRRRFRLLCWSLFGLALVGLGFLLQQCLSPWPRCTIPFESSFSFGWTSPDGHFLATGTIKRRVGPLASSGMETPIQVWDTRSGKLQGTFLKGTGAWRHEFSPNFKYLAACDGSSTAAQTNLYLVDLQTGNQKRLPFPGSFDYRFSPQGTFVLVSQVGEMENENTPFHLVSTTTGRIESTFPGCTFHDFVPDESLLVYTHGDDTDLRIWNTQLQKVVHTLPKVKTVVLAPDGRALAASVADGLVLLDLTTFERRPFRAKTKMPEAVSNMLFSPDGKTLAIFLEREGVELCDVATGKQRPGNFDRLSEWKWNFNNGRDDMIIGSAAFSPDSKLMALAGLSSGARCLAVWDVSSGALLWLNKAEDGCRELAFTADSRFLIADPTRKVEVLEAQTGKRRQFFNVRLTHVLQEGEEETGGWGLFSIDKRFLQIQSEAVRQANFWERLFGNWLPKRNSIVQQVRVAEVASGRELARLESDGLEEALLLDDGKTLATKHNENGKYLMRIWDLPLRPPLLLVIGIPLALGLLVLLFSRWRARRRVRAEAAKALPIPTPCPKTGR